MKFKAVIFDMDGVLVDSEMHWFKAEKKFLDTYSIPWSREHEAMVTGRSLRESATLMKAMHGLTQSVDEILQTKNNVSEEIYTDHAQPMPGVQELLALLEKYELATAIASGSSLKRIEMIVDRFAWRRYFDELVSTDHVDYVGKPDPAIYRYTAEQLQLHPSECVVIEDSVNGVRAAKGAGMSCIATLDDRWCHGDYSEADLIVKGLTDSRVRNFIGI